MSSVQELIEMLQSDNSDSRYDACEELRVSPWLPPEALKALRLTVNDANPDIADAAQRAIKLHISDKANDAPASMVSSHIYSLQPTAQQSAKEFERMRHITSQKEEDELLIPADEPQSLSVQKKSLQSLIMERLGLFIVGFAVGAFLGFKTWSDYDPYPTSVPLITYMLTGGLALGGLSLIFGKGIWKLLSHMAPFW